MLNRDTNIDGILNSSCHQSMKNQGEFNDELKLKKLLDYSVEEINEFVDFYNKSAVEDFSPHEVVSKNIDRKSPISSQDSRSSVSSDDTLSSVCSEGSTSLVFSEDSQSLLSSGDRRSSVGSEYSKSSDCSEDRRSLVCSEYRKSSLCSEYRNSSLCSEKRRSSISSEDTKSLFSLEDRRSSVSLEDRQSIAGLEDRKSLLSSEHRTKVGLKDRRSSICSDYSKTSLCSEDRRSSISSEDLKSLVSEENTKSSVCSEYCKSLVSLEDIQTLGSSYYNLDCVKFKIEGEVDKVGVSNLQSFCESKNNLQYDTCSNLTADTGLIQENMEVQRSCKDVQHRLEDFKETYIDEINDNESNEHSDIKTIFQHGSIKDHVKLKETVAEDVDIFTLNNRMKFREIQSSVSSEKEDSCKNENKFDAPDYIKMEFMDESGEKEESALDQTSVFLINNENEEKETAEMLESFIIHYDLETLHKQDNILMEKIAKAVDKALVICDLELRNSEENGETDVPENNPQIGLDDIKNDVSVNENSPGQLKCMMLHGDIDNSDIDNSETISSDTNIADNYFEALNEPATFDNSETTSSDTKNADNYLESLNEPVSIDLPQNMELKVLEEQFKKPIIISLNLQEIVKAETLNPIDNATEQFEILANHEDLEDLHKPEVAIVSNADQSKTKPQELYQNEAFEINSSIHKKEKACEYSNNAEDDMLKGLKIRPGGLLQSSNLVIDQAENCTEEEETAELFETTHDDSEWFKKMEYNRTENKEEESAEQHIVLIFHDNLETKKEIEKRNVDKAEYTFDNFDTKPQEKYQTSASVMSSISESGTSDKGNGNEEEETAKLFERIIFK